jgi:hypothetical protein
MGWQAFLLFSLNVFMCAIRGLPPQVSAHRWMQAEGSIDESICESIDPRTDGGVEADAEVTPTSQ